MNRDKIKRIAIVIILAAVIVVAATVGVLLFGNKKDETPTDAMKFKTEYEALNGEKAYGDNVYQTLNISENNKIKYTDLTGAVEFLEKGTGLIYFGFPNCPWCRGMLPTLLDKVDKSDLKNLLYVDMTGLRDTFEVKDGKAVKTKDASPEYYRLLELLDEYLESYKVVSSDGKEVAYDTGEKRIYVPLVVAVNDGTIKEAVTSPVKLDGGQTQYDPLTNKQKNDLEKLFTDMIEMTSAAVCDEHC